MGAFKNVMTEALDYGILNLSEDAEEARENILKAEKLLLNLKDFFPANLLNKYIAHVEWMNANWPKYEANKWYLLFRYQKEMTPVLKSLFT